MARIRGGSVLGRNRGRVPGELRLDLGEISGHVSGMKILLLALILTATAAGQKKNAPIAGVPPRQLVPVQVMRRAQMAAQKVVDQTVRGNFQAALNSMNPKYVEVISRPFGGPKKFKASMLKMMNQMGANGIAIQSILTRMPKTALEVDYGLQDVVVNGEPVMGPDGKPKREAAYRSWMVFVPTVTDYLIKDQNPPQKLVMKRKWDFQVAISPKREEDWTFISGSSINPLELRRIFPFLPKDKKQFQFPEVKTQTLEGK